MLKSGFFGGDGGSCTLVRNKYFSTSTSLVCCLPSVALCEGGFFLFNTFQQTSNVKKSDRYLYSLVGQTAERILTLFTPVLSHQERINTDGFRLAKMQTVEHQTI